MDRGRPTDAFLKRGEDWCANCRYHLVHAANLCKLCHRYLHRTGKMRPHSVAHKRWQREAFG